MLTVDEAKEDRGPLLAAERLAAEGHFHDFVGRGSAKRGGSHIGMTVLSDIVVPAMVARRATDRHA